jgi:hypothetical protein
MKALIHFYSISQARELAIELIPFGIESFKTSSTEDVIIILSKEPDIKILITENYEYDFLKKTKEINSDLIIYLLIYRPIETEKFLTLKEIAINSCITFNNNIQEVADELVTSIIKTNIKINEKRHFLRITPPEIDNFEAAILHKAKKNYIRGKVLNISMGGFAMIPFKTENIFDLELLKSYDPVFLSFQGFQLKTVSTLLAIRNKICAFRFDNIETLDRRRLASYIHDKLEEKTKELLQITT